jgi:hypothetical protein
MNWLGFGVVLALTAFIIGLVAHSRIDPRTRSVVQLALALRVLGVLLYVGLVNYFYGGGDFQFYYERGLLYAEQIWNGNPSAVLSGSGRWLGRWWGSEFVILVTGLVLTLIGPSLLGASLVFSLLACGGLLLFAAAFRVALPDVPQHRYLCWILLFPSLWFWPSAIGKEPLILLGLGLTVYAYVRPRGTNWLLLATGLLLTTSVRPQVGAVAALSILVAQWLAFGGRWTVRKVAEGVVVAALCTAGVWFAMTNLGVGIAQSEGVHEYVERRADVARRVEGSRATGVTLGLRGVPVAVSNVLFRPLPWEARNPLQLLAALEIAAFWVLAVLRRRQLLQALRGWRKDRFRRVALAFIALYAISFGFVVLNLGIIARQRILLFPFLFLFLEASPSPAPMPEKSRRHAPLRGVSGTAMSRRP